MGAARGRDFWRQRDQPMLIPIVEYATPLNVCNYLNQTIKPPLERARKEAEALGPIAAGHLAGVNHQAFRRTCATYMQKHGTVKDVQAHLRHASANTTVGVYMKEIPVSVRAAVEELDLALSCATVSTSPVN